MTRLFVTLYALILAAAFGFIFTVNPIVMTFIDGSQSEYAKDSFGGVFYLLDEKIQSSTDQVSVLNDIQSLFQYDVRLMTEEEFNPSQAELNSLKKYGVVVRKEDKADFVYARSVIETDKIWLLQIEPTQSDLDQRLVIGPVKLFEEKLAAYPEAEWSQRINEFDFNFAMPLQLIALDSAELQTLAEEKKQALEQHRVIGLDVTEENERYFYRLSGSDQVLKIGPIPVPSFVHYLTPLIFAVLALLFASVIFLWMRPLWGNLSSLDAAAKAFGAGDFSARAGVTRFSPIKPLSSTFNQMALRVQSLISSHKDLTNAVSHEIRTPLARMRFGLEMLEMADNADDKKRFTNEMATDIEELDALVGELLTYARFERSKPSITLTEHVMIPWLYDQISRAQKLSDEITITLHHQGVSAHQKFCFEGRLLARALSNLLRNALQYSQKQVQISLSQTEQHFVLCVEDDGPGVPEKDRETLFDPFTRVDESRSRDTGGFGIGLAIVKQVADWHNASITVGDSSLGGARFILRIPDVQVSC